METPKPVDVSRLRNILGSARAVMNKVESGDYDTGNIDGRALTESTVEQVAAERGANTQNVAPQMVGNTPHYPNMSKSKLPDAIKQAMMESPIPQANMQQTFSLDDVMDYEKDEKTVPPPNRPRQAQQSQNQNINISNDQIRQIVKEEMNVAIKEEMISFFTKYFAKTLAEETQKKVVQHLLKEGRIKVKKK